LFGHLLFSENILVESANIVYLHEADVWPYTFRKSYALEIPQTVEFDIQRSGKIIQFDIFVEPTRDIQICEIEIYGKGFNGYIQQLRD
jgi:hypothetical protein